MASNVSISITADVVDLQAKFAVARAETSALTSELNKLARQAATSGMTDQLKVQLDQAAEAALNSKIKLVDLKTQINALNSGSDSSVFASLTSGVESFNGALGGLGLAVSAAGLVNFARSAVSAAAAIQEQADKLNLSVDAIQTYQFAAREAGVSTDDANIALQRFLANLGEVESTGTGPAAEGIKQLGLTADELRGDPLEALVIVARALDNIHDSAQKAEIIKDIFGRGGQDVNAMLKTFGEGTDDVTKKVQDLTDAMKASGEAFDPEMTKSAKDAQIALEGFEARVDVLTTETLVAFGAAAKNYLIGNLKDALALLNLFGVAKMPEIPGSGKPKGNGSDPWSGLAMPQPTMAKPDDGLTAPNIVTTDESNKTANEARHLADELTQIWEQAGQKRIEGEESNNAFLLSMGQETIEQWKDQATKLENERYAIELDGLAKRETADKGDKAALAKDNAEKVVLAQEYQNRIQQINQQAAEKTKTLNAQLLADWIKGEQDKLAVAIDSVNQDYENNKIGAGKKLELEVGLTDQIDREIIKRLEAARNANGVSVADYAKYTAQIEALEKQMTGQLITETKQYESALKEAYAPITNSFNSMINSMISGNAKLGAALKQGVLSFVEESISADLKRLENAFFTDRATTAAHLAGNEAKAASDQATSDTGLLTQLLNSEKSIEADAAKAAADVYAWAAPALGPFAAIPAAATFVAVEAFGNLLPGLDVGTTMVPRDMHAMIHAGEIVIPKTFADGMRAGDLSIGKSDGGSGDASQSITINTTNNVTSMNKRDVELMLQKHPAAVVKSLRSAAKRLMISPQNNLKPGRLR